MCGLRRRHYVRSSYSFLHYRNLACNNLCCYPFAAINCTCRTCAACNMEFVLAKPPTKLSRPLVRLLSLFVSRILRLFTLLATVSGKCTSDVAKKVVQKRRRRCMLKGINNGSVGGPRLERYDINSGTSQCGGTGIETVYSLCSDYF
jgi:hypothetical protein